MMAARSLATIVQTLVYYDGPQILLLRSPRDMRMIAAAVEHEGMDFPFFACTVVEREFKRYMDGKADLLYLYKSSHNFYFFDLGKEGDNKVPIRRATEAERTDEKYYPDTGFFSRSHTELVTGFGVTDNESYVYKIDGSWDASEFAKFYSNIEDMYSLVVTLTKVSAEKVADTAKEISKSIEERLWRGGGSYVGFYDALFDLARSIFPLRMGKLRYASPGEIEVRGNGDAFSDIDALMTSFDDNQPELTRLNGIITAVLTREHLRTASADTGFPASALEQFVKNQAMELCKNMGVDGDVILELCKNNVLVFSKLVLSIYRRIKILHTFQAEGRIRDRRALQLAAQ